MRQYARPKLVPAALTKSGTKELTRAIAHYSGPPSAKAFPFAAYKCAEAKKELESLFHGKCAYCETYYSSSAPVDVEHFRPKGAVEGDAVHPGYWWLAMAWDNLLPSCIDCNRRRNQPTPTPSISLKSLFSKQFSAQVRVLSTGKQHAFPVKGKRLTYGDGRSVDSEEALLIDPTNEDPNDDIEFLVDPVIGVSLVLPRGKGSPEIANLPQGTNTTVGAEAVRAGVSERGAVSIQVFGLNRLGLVQDRTRLLRQLEFLGDLVVELLTMAADHTDPATAKKLTMLAERILIELKSYAEPSRPYSSMVTAWLRDFRARSTMTASRERAR